MKESTRIYADLTATLEKIRGLHREFTANEPIVRSWKLAPAEEAENSRLADRRERISVEVAKLEAEATRLRKSYSDAMAAEQLPPAAPATTPALDALQAKEHELAATIEAARGVRGDHALAALSGDKKAQAALGKATDEQLIATLQLQNVALARTAAEEQRREEAQEFRERQADEALAAAKAAAADLVVWGRKFDNLCGYLSAHFDEFAALRTKLVKSNADINMGIVDQALSSASRTRAAKAAGLAAAFSIDTTVAAIALGPSIERALNVAIRRPQVKKENAA